MRILDLHPGSHPAASFVGDLRDPHVLASALADVQVVFHLAARAGARRSVDDAPETVDVNVRGTALLLEAAERAGVERFVLASSVAVFGETGTSPARVDRPRHPVSPYGASKLGAEGLVGATAATSELHTAVARLSSVYGPHARDDQSVRRFVHGLRRGTPLTWFGDGTSLRDYLHVDDAVGALLVAEELASPEQPAWVHGATGQATSVLELVEHLQRLAGTDAKLDVQHPQPGDPAHALLRPERFEATIPLAEGLEMLWSA